MGNRLLNPSASRHVFRPLYKQRHPQPTFKVGELPASEGFVNAWQANVSGATIVAREDNNGVFGETFFF